MSMGYRPPASVIGFVEPDTSDMIDWHTSSLSAVNATRDDSEHPLPKPDDPPTAKQWDYYRAIITELYINDNGNLKKVAEAMKSNYHFKARYTRSLLILHSKADSLLT